MNNSIIHEFPHVPANKRSLYMRKAIFGKGVNDSDYVTSAIINGKRVSCPIYQKWHSMIERCYSHKYQVRRPSYIGCTVCDEWLSFSTFRSWVIKQDWQGKDLDKDILTPNNRIYSPSNCLFIDSCVNSLLTAHDSGRGKYPIGVHLFKKSNKFMALCRVDGKSKYLGLFEDKQEAHEAFLKAKSKYIISVANEQSEVLKNALIVIADLVASGQYYQT